MSAPTLMARHDADLHPSPPEGQVRVGPRSESRSEPRSGRAALETAHRRLLIVSACFALGFSVIGVRLVDLATSRPESAPKFVERDVPAVVRARADITDRNGVVLATDLQVASLFADARVILNPAESAARLVSAVPDLNEAEVRNKLASGRSFVWLKRHLTPKEQADVNRLGLPGIGFQQEQRRMYPLGALTSHVVGFSDIDNKGIAGIEQYFDGALRAFPQSGINNALRLSIDSRVQFAVREELLRGMADFRAKGVTGIVMDARSGELVAMVSVPDFDPNRAGDTDPDARFNRATLGVFEPGSTMKVITVAMALELGTAKLEERFDATKPLRISRFTINDDHAKNKWLTVPEVFIYSSNIGAARMAMEVGPVQHKAFLDRLGLLKKPEIELPEAGAPLVPDPWREISTVTIAFGHGIAMSPLQYSAGLAAVVNGGFKISPTLLAGGRNAPPTRVLSQETSDIMRRLLRLNVEEGTGRQAEAPGYAVGGKTGTAEKAVAGGYKRNALVSSFAAAFPMNDPKYVVLVMIDEPNGTSNTQGFATGGWTAAPIVSRIILRTGPLLGVAPVDVKSPDVQRQLFVSLDGRRTPSVAF